MPGELFACQRLRQQGQQLALGLYHRQAGEALQRFTELAQVTHRLRQRASELAAVWALLQYGQRVAADDVEAATGQRRLAAVEQHGVGT